MTRSVKAALLSGLVFPGVGHLFLKHYLRGLILLLLALVVLSVIITAALGQALTIVDAITSGEVPLEAQAITELVSKSTDTPQGPLANIAVLVFGVCWVIGIIDSYRLGNAHAK